MLRKTIWIFMSVALLCVMQTGANELGSTPSTAKYTAIDNAAIPGNPDPGTDQTDSTIFLDDFESGQGDWTFVDATVVGAKWHINDYNGYNSTNSWWCADTVIGGYDNHWLQYLVSPSLNFSSVTNPVLTFKLFHALELLSGGYPPGYDGWDGANVWVSTDGGGRWTVITPTFPAYHCTSLYSFGFEWGMGEGIAGWTDMSGGWLDAEFDLSAYVGQSNVMIRFAFCSDPAESTVNNPSIFGLFVDEISVDDGGNNLMYNDADGIATPSEFTFDVGGTSGDYWALIDWESHTPTHSMNCDIAGHYNLSDALVSPWLDIPANVNVKFQFWLWCDMPDFTGSGGPSLEDYYHVEISTDEVVWETIFYDYGDVTRPGGTGWALYEPGMPFNGNIEMSLSDWGGEQVKLRWRVTTDDDDNGGVGTGLYIDDVELFITGLDNDVAAKNMIVPMPTSAYFDSIHCSVELHNVGNLDQPSVPAFWRFTPGAFTPLAPWASIPVLSYVTKEFYWVLPTPSSYFLDAYTALGIDENLMNDTTQAGMVEITAEDVFEFGYDGREYSFEAPVYQFNYETGEGTYILYTPEDDGIDINLDGVELKALFGDVGTIRIHILEPGTPTTPGPEVTNWEANVSIVQPNWQTFDLAGVNFLQNTRTDFWVWYEVLNDLGTPHLLGWDEISPQAVGHFFNDFGSGMSASDFDFFARAVFSPYVGVKDGAANAQPLEFALQQNTPNPFNPVTSIEFSLEKAGNTRLMVFDLMGRTVAVLADGNYTAGSHHVTFNAENLSSGVYVYRLEADGRSLERKMLFLK